ncbi:VWA domain-containing protein, partial [Deltaproteobacteria bacterium OttesenSCG-928-K17]|nr:VWA domain-containing protein [Deltaproteobacteria bacterium OttesenSCG-928-K17]
MTAREPVFPLAALVGQQKMVSALLILAVDPSLGGLLLVGEKGTAKSTAARALAEIMPVFQAVGGCPCHCPVDAPTLFCPDCREKYLNGRPLKPAPARSPFRTVPLGVTEDRLLGGLDWEATLKEARPVLRPGILGEANGGLAYIDEINLLEISLAHLLLDAVSSGRIILEREGLSASYPTRAALLATMNPEEGHLGPQLADRFALTVHLTGESDPALRAEVVRRRLAFEADPFTFRAAYAEKTKALAADIKAGRDILDEVKFSEPARELIARLAVSDRLAGHRGDLALAKAARARAALLGLTVVSPREVLDIAEMVLASRRRPAPAKEPLRVKLERVEKADDGRPELFEPVYVADSPEVPPEYKGGAEEGDEAEPVVQVFKSAEGFHAVTPQNRRDVGPRGRSGRRGSRETPQAIGRSYRTTARRTGRPLSLSATLRAAAPFQAARRERAEGEPPTIILSPADFREKVYRQKTGRLVIFVVDSSGSIGTLYRMEEAKAAALALLSEAYQKRDRVALIAFYGVRAEMLLPPTNSPDLAARLLSELPSGGKTPLSAALVMARKLLMV